jgi:hypothetical protein
VVQALYIWSSPHEKWQKGDGQAAP